jgi:uncharacterized protein
VVRKKDKNTSASSQLTPAILDKWACLESYDQETQQWLLSVSVKPNARRERLFFDLDILCLHTTAPPTKGKANKEVIKFLASTFEISKSDIHLIRGHTSHTKLFSLSVDPQRIDKVLSSISK